MTDLHVIFGTGPVARATMESLRRRDLPVRMVNRSGQFPGGDAPAGVEVLAGDARDAEFSRAAAAGASVVYQCLNPEYHQWAELFPALQNGVLAAAEANDALLVSMENVYGYGRPDGAPLTEQFWDGIVLGLQLVPLQLLTLILTLVLPGVGLVLGLCITGWALGRGLFVAVAMRRMGRQAAVALVAARRGAVLLPGVALAGLGLVPLANLLVPVLGIAAMVHVLQGPGLMQPRLGLSPRSGP